ncbi:GLPGLI family protein [Chryseobacterium sp. SNU WT5]|uniref:GLPGLI family protein n=1 Tax=Chryseobacterium sp. SNU WT5 TaxID=2594269 RepID=UPI0016283B86|nr:GLPGLI family protein [Chryseobacterium sp. SNU WT5]
MRISFFKVLRILLFTLFLNSYGQSFRFVYDYEFVKDNDNPKQVSNYMMYLDVKKNTSQFYSYQNFNIDSTKAAFAKKGQFFMAPNKEYIDFKIVKDLGANKINMLTKVHMRTFDVEDLRNLNWILKDKKDTILGKEVFSAAVNFAGREWAAWYSPEIAVQDGPYKFHGLPGLIFTIEDATKTHKFSLVAIYKVNDFTDYPETRESSMAVKISQEEYAKIYRDYRKDPLQSLRGRYPDQIDSDGTFKSGVEIFREEEKLFKNRIKKDNNIIEIDLLR